MAAVTWLTTAQAAARIHRPTKFVRVAAEHGDLHGHQRSRNGRPLPKSRWLFAEASVDAFAQGLDQHAQRRACGCPAVHAIRQTA